MKWVIVILVGLLTHVAPVSAAPISDLATDLFEKGPGAIAPTPRSPFLPSYRAGEDVEIGSLVVQGIIVGASKKMALLSGGILKEGDRIGRYTVQAIRTGEVVLADEEILYSLRMAGSVPPSTKVPGFQVHFENAPLRDALTLLARASDLNLIAPENLEGRVSVTFERIELMEALRSILKVNGYEYAMESGVLRVGRPEAFAGGTDLKTESLQLKYATAKALVDKVKPLLSERGSVIAEERSNTLVVKDRDAIVYQVKEFITSVDRKDQQVQIEGRIVDATQNFSRNLGIRWGVSSNPGKVTVSGTGAVGTNADTGNTLNVNLGAANPTAGIGLIIGRLGGGTNIESQLLAAESKGEVRILSRPTVTTINNMPAKIRSGTKIYVKSTSSINIGTAGAAAGGEQAALQEIDTGIELTVTPQISIDDHIKLTIEASESEADFSRTVDGIPAILDNTASTTVLIKDGETTVIGGLYRVRTTKERRGVPGFQHIPIVGLLFQSRSKTRDDTELMIFITPKIL